jgi:hypothetical protein
MLFRVPKFIEYETKLVGPLTVRQSLFILIHAGITFLIYLAIGKKNYSLFLFSAFFLMGIGITFAFGRVEGRPLSTVFLNFFKHSFRPQRYLWKKPERPILTFEIKKYVPRKPEESPFQIPEASHLRKAKIKVETQTK